MSSTLSSPNLASLPIREPRRWMFALAIPHAAVPALAAILYFSLGQPVWAALIPFVWFYVGIPLLDQLVGEDFTNPPETDYERLERTKLYDWFLYLTIPVIALGSFANMAMLVNGSLPIWALIMVIYAAGIGAGQALVVSHELGHRTNAFDRHMAKIANGLVGYGHFSIEHNRGHHVLVATPEDPASARMNETVYAFARRDLWGALKGGWTHEAKRLRNKGLPLISHHNEILQSYAVTVALGAVFVAFLGWAVLPWLLIHHFFGYFALTLVNYIEHYGLKRDKLANGKYEPCQPRHSWNTNHMVSNILEMNLQRHSDHHANPQRPYQCLRNFEELPRLPSGYPGCISLALVPPLWFKVMNPKVREWAGGDDSKLNWGPEPA